MELAKGATVLHQLHQTTLAEFTILNSFWSTKLSDDLSVPTICLSYSVKMAIVNPVAGGGGRRSHDLTTTQIL